jgi:hypothetical protein
VKGRLGMALSEGVATCKQLRSITALPKQEKVRLDHLWKTDRMAPFGMTTELWPCKQQVRDIGREDEHPSIDTSDTKFQLTPQSKYRWLRS